MKALTGVPDCFHFIDVIVVDDVIKGSVEFIEEVDDLIRGAGAGQLCKTHDITEKEKRRHMRQR